MAGLALGSLLISRLADLSRRPVLVYAVLELLVGLVGVVASFALIEVLGRSYVRLHILWAGNAAAILAARVGIVLACLLPSTALMGATLPLLAAWITRRGRHLQVGLSWLYAVNTYGAVAGVLLTGFVLLGLCGERASVIIAGVLNLTAAGLALGLWAASANEDASNEDASSKQVLNREAAQEIAPYPMPLRSLALLTFFISGLTALGYEVLWMRLLVLLLETSIYTFSIILAVLLLGIAAGSWWSRQRVRLQRCPLIAFGMLEILIGTWAVLGMLALPTFDKVLAYFRLVGSAPESSLASLLWPLAIGSVACLFWVFPVAWLFGVQFPLGVRCCAADLQAAGRATGNAYAVNTAGTIVGALAAGFFLIPLLGTATSMLLLAGLNLLLGCALIVAAPRRERTFWPLTAATLGFSLLVVVHWVGDPYLRVMAMRVERSYGKAGRIYAHYERPAATTVAAGLDLFPQARFLFVNGISMTSLATEAKLMTHLPYQLIGHPKRMLILCFGMGTSLRSTRRYADLQVDAVDIVPEVFECFGYFHKNASRLLANPRIALHADDARNYLLTHPGQYDVITMDPAPPIYGAGTVNLYTREFFGLCRQRLSPQGLFCVWLPPASETDAMMIMKSYLEVFPHATVWGGLTFPGFYLIAGREPLTITPARVAELAENLSRIPELGEWEPTYQDPENVKKMYLTDAAGLTQLLADVPAVTDDRPYTEFPLWRQILNPAAARQLDANVLRERLPGIDHGS
jgi:spermidine synthase